jgi:hypothetical protein
VNAGTALRWFLLSWDWVPCRRCTSLASTPGSRSSRRTGAARCRFTFRPRGFAPPRRLSPRGSCGSVAPRNRPRVHRVSCMPAGGPPEGGLDAGDSPRGAFRTLRRVSLVSSRTRITAAVAFLSLPSCPAGGSGRSRGPPTAIPADAGGVPPWNRPGDRGSRGSEELREPGSRGRPTAVPKNLGGHAQGSEEPGRQGRRLRRAGATGSLEGSADPKRGGPDSAMR